MDEVSQIRQKIDIVAFISEFISLKKLGRNFKTVCPFHSEKTPSFVVSPERQIWHCFGCGKGGDVFTFLMEYERMEFPEALRTLAKRAGITLSRGSLSMEGTGKKKETLYKIGHLASEFYHYILTKHDKGNTALEYLRGRGIGESAIARYKLGFAPNMLDGLIRYLTEKKNISLGEIEDAGLILRVQIGMGQRYVDRFRSRIMFPLSDHRGNIVGFSGRVLGDPSRDSGRGEAKYVNTPETLVYHKGDLLYGLDLAKEAIRKEGALILVEGEFDVIQGGIHGLNNMVAIKGTALTENQVNLLARFTDTVHICLDWDNAGISAMWRSIAMLEQKEILANVVKLDGAKDPDESLRNDKASFFQAVKHAIPVYDFLIDSAVSRSDPKTPDGKKKISDQVLPFFLKMQNEIVKDHYIKKLADILSVSEESILKELEKLRKTQQIGHKLREADSVPPSRRSTQELLEEYLIALILQSEDVSFGLREVKEIITQEFITIPVYKRVFTNLSEFFDKKEEFSIQAFISFAPPELHSAIDTCYLLSLPLFSEKKRLALELRKKATEVKAMTLKIMMHELSTKMRKEEEDQHEEKLNLLKKEFNDVVEMLRSLTLSTLPT